MKLPSGGWSKPRELKFLKKSRFYMVDAALVRPALFPRHALHLLIADTSEGAQTRPLFSVAWVLFFICAVTSHVPG